MTPDERHLIEELFDRLSQQRPEGMDRQAEALIRELVRDVPDAAYMLVQTVLVYEHQLQEAADRIRSLEAERDDRASSGASSGSFLQGRLGASQGARPAAVRSSYEYRNETSSVPRVGGSGAWGVKGPAAAPAPQQQQHEPARASGGGFFRSAMATAAGVAGGMLAADSLRSLFGGKEAQATDASQTGSDAASWQDANATQDALQDEQIEREDAGYDDGGGDFDIGDIEI